MASDRENQNSRAETDFSFVQIRLTRDGLAPPTQRRLLPSSACTSILAVASWSKVAAGAPAIKAVGRGRG